MDCVKFYYTTSNTEDKNTSETGDKIRRKFKSVVSGNNIVSFDGLDENLKREFSEGLNNALPDTAQVLRQQIKEADFAYTDDRKSYFNKANKVVYLKPTVEASTVAHELFHRLDKVNGITKNHSDMIFEMLQKDWNALLKNSDNDVIYYLVEKFPEAFYKNRKGKIQIKSEYRGLSDIISAMSDNDIMLGFHHSAEYWNKDGKKEAEAWAQFGRITYDNNSEVIEMFETIFTNFSKYAIMLLKEVI